MLPAPRSRPPSRAPRISDRPETRRLQRSSPRVVPTWETPPSGGASRANSGGRIRTCDLRVMSPTSYQTAPPRNRDEEVIRPANRRSTRLTGRHSTHRIRPFTGQHRRMRPLSQHEIRCSHDASLRLELRVPRPTYTFCPFGTWRSPVAHCNGVAGVAGSNPAVPIDRRSTPSGL